MALPSLLSKCHSFSMLIIYLLTKHISYVFSVIVTASTLWEKTRGWVSKIMLKTLATKRRWRGGPNIRCRLRHQRSETKTPPEARWSSQHIWSSKEANPESTEAWQEWYWNSYGSVYVLDGILSPNWHICWFIVFCKMSIENRGKRSSSERSWWERRPAPMFWSILAEMHLPYLPMPMQQTLSHCGHSTNSRASISAV